MAFEPVDFIARLAALVPKPRVNLTRYHGVLAPNHRWRGLVTPAKHGKGVKPLANTEVRSSAECRAAMTWAQRLKRVFNIDIEVCSRCGGSVRDIASFRRKRIHNLNAKSARTLENHMARTVVGARSELTEYELRRSLASGEIQ